MRKQLNVRQSDGGQGSFGGSETIGRREQSDLQDSEAAGAKVDAFMALIEGRMFIRECIQRSLQSAFPSRIQAFSNSDEFKRNCPYLPSLILLSALEEGEEIGADDFKIIAEAAPGIPIVVLASGNNAKMARAAIFHGAKGYIPVSLGFDIAVEAVRFVLAGGTYVPIDYLLTRNGSAPSPAMPTPGAVTARELAVVRAIQQGKSNKIIAYELGMREGTVKVHVRRIMKKLNAKNRTDAAIKSQSTLITSRANNSLDSQNRESWASGENF